MTMDRYAKAKIGELFYSILYGELSERDVLNARFLRDVREIEDQWIGAIAGADLDESNLESVQEVALEELGYALTGKE